MHFESVHVHYSFYFTFAHQLLEIAIDLGRMELTIIFGK